MTIRLDLQSAFIKGLVLAKVGNPSRDEPLQTSKQVFLVEEENQDILSNLFLRPFKSLSLVGHRFRHHSSLEKHELHQISSAIFEDEEHLLVKGQEIAQRLYEKSSHPNIKSGDLCIALLGGIHAGDEGEEVHALCILKSESVSPFLSINTNDGDLELTTEHGINPEKIDKGVLIVDHLRQKGFYSLTFDRAGAESRFWVKDFLSIQPIADSALLTKKVAEIAVQAVTQEKAHAPAEQDSSPNDAPPWEVNDNAKQALTYFDQAKQFSLQEFEEKALRTPEAKKKFREEKERLEKEEGVSIQDGFDISKKDASKARKLMKNIMRLDSGVEIRLKPKVVADPSSVLEKGFDEGRGKNYIKIYFNKDLA